jgi:ribosomal protein L44E
MSNNDPLRKKRKQSALSGGQSDDSAPDRFAAVMAAPVFGSKADFQPHPADYDFRVVLTLNCDRCGAQDIDPVVYCYATPGIDVCRRCYNAMRVAMTEPALLAAHERQREQWLEEYIEANKPELEQRAEEASVNASIIQSHYTLH